MSRGMMRFKAASLDDEPNAHIVLRALLADVPDIVLERTFTAPYEALAALNQQPCELLFLDVAMPVSGLDFLRALTHPPITVLLTASMEHALAAFELGVRDYLLKPVSGQRLQRCLENIRPLLLAARSGTAIGAPARLPVRCGNEHCLIDITKTPRIEASGNFSIVYTERDAIFASEPMKELERRLAPLGFVRIHKSHLVNRVYIRRIGASEVVLRDGLTLPIGRAYRLAVADALGA